MDVEFLPGKDTLVCLDHCHPVRTKSQSGFGAYLVSTCVGHACKVLQMLLLYEL